MKLELGILLALLCAMTANVGFFFKHRGACSVAPVDIRHPLRSAYRLYSSPWFSLGMGIACAAWGLHVAALSLAPMSYVQVALASGDVLIAVMAERLFGMPVGPRQWWGLSLTALALVLLALTLPGAHGPSSHFSEAAMIAFEAGLFGVGGLLIVGPRVGAGRAEHHGVMLAAAAGVLFGVSDTAIKALSGIVTSHGLLALALSPWLAVTLLASAAAFYSSARSLQDGAAVPVIAITGTTANIAGIAGGIVVFGDPIAASPLGIAIEAIAFLLVIVASALIPAPTRVAAPAPAPAPAAA